MFARGVRRRPLALALLAAGCCLVESGCVERRYTIRSNPPGALAFVNGEEIGPTPVSRSFTYYGTRDVTLVADGYQTLKVRQPVKRPWYDNYITEFFSENLVPWTIRDEREFTYSLTPQTAAPPEEVLGRAEALRQRGKLPPPPRPKGLLGRLGLGRE
jgi:hypothetical protein